MFGFFKKRNKVNVSEESEVKELSQEEKQNISDDIENKLQVIKKMDQSDNEKLSLEFEQLGLLYSELDQTDEAIAALEKSLSHQKSIGDGYKTLMKLYNMKRAEAARNKNNDAIDKWMNKMDEMRQIAKEVTIKRR